MDSCNDVVLWVQDILADTFPLDAVKKALIAPQPSN